MAQRKITSSGLDAAVTTDIVSSVTDGAPGALDTLNELAAALGDDANFATTVTNSLATVTNSLATKATLVKSGTEPTDKTAGLLWYNTSSNILYSANGTQYIKVAASIPTLSSVSGDITKDQAGNLTLTGTNFLNTNLTVTFTAGGTDYDVTVTPTNGTTATVAIPAGVYGQNGGTVVTIKVTNDDSAQSNSLTKTIVALPSGGTITTSGSYRIHTFTSSDTFNTENETLSVEYLVVAGGGGGGSAAQWASGGGGAGGMLTGSTSLNGSYAVSVGSGGVGGSGNVYESGTSGAASSIGSVVTTVGGGYGSTAGGVNGGNGGSGGGSGAGLGHSGGSGTSGQGNNGGTGELSSGSGGNAPWGAGGGGGKGSSGGGGTNSGGNGGSGASSSITGSSVTYAGGGGGGEYNSGNPGSGGSGGGGNGSSGSTNAGNGGVNLGAGGGGSGATGAGGNGGSGIVVIRYQL